MKLCRFWMTLVIVGGVGLAGTAEVRSQERFRPGSQAPASAQSAAALAKKVDRAIELTSHRYLTGGVHTPWQIMHGILALRQNFLVKVDGQKVSALEWISSGVTHKGDPWFESTRYGGRAHPYTEPHAFEGHPNQFLAILTMCNLPPDYEIKTGNGEETITIADIVRNTQKTVNRSEEITWTLWGLSHYLSPDATWTNQYGEQWSIEQLVEMQTRAPVNNEVACGGTHGLFALTYARNRYLQTGQPLRGIWLEADQKIKQHIAKARELQNRDGSFSASFFVGSAYSPDFKTRLSTSGHTLEWLTLALYDNELNEAWYRRAVDAMAQDLIDHAKDPADCGPLYHALNALIIYRQRTRPEFQSQAPAGRDAALSRVN